MVVSILLAVLTVNSAVQAVRAADVLHVVLDGSFGVFFAIISITHFYWWRQAKHDPIT
jgi:hypothetical protein